ncbi:MAG: inositol 2-dehydrogenase [Acidimicrobiia bacterium]|jgi:myo-inositol 2-dehydrogenase/D-chiro-inositol 1-dehydrogenase
MTVKLGIIGTGRIAHAHAAGVSNSPDAELVAVNDLVADVAEAFAAKYGCRADDVEGIAADPDITGVLICTPTPTHSVLIEKFAKAGKHVFCEKPVDLDIEKAKEVVAAAENAGVKLMLGFNRRFDPSFLAVRAAIDDGTVGDVELVLITSRDPEPPPVAYARVSGGLFRDMTIHDLDMARFLLGEDPVVVSAHGSALVSPDIAEFGDIDTASVILETASGKQAVITNSRRATYGYDQRVEVHGSRGVVYAENQHEPGAVIGNENGYTKTPLQNFFMDRYIPAYTNEIKAFVKCIADDTEPPATGADGVIALRIADACFESLHTGKRVRI